MHQSTRLFAHCINRLSRDSGLTLCFTHRKWRSPLEIDVANGQPSDLTIETNMRDLARYALICQSQGLVPIVEPDIALKGTHDLETAVRVNVKVQSELFHQMNLHGVYMEGAVLKSNMVNPGKDCPVSYTVEEIAEANLQVFRRCFPTAMTTANFLSGGQSLEDASARLDAINKRKGRKDPYVLYFPNPNTLNLNPKP